ncbi:MAG: GntR family transcriptional regulator [Steroidobacteraceae bacterium]
MKRAPETEKGRTDQDDVYQCLRSKILAQELKPGIRLVEDELTQMLEAGRTPVRESLLRLQGEGLVSRRNRGWVVESVDPRAFRSVFEARMAIEGYAARLAAERITPEALRRLGKYVDSMDACETITRSQLNQLNKDFHSEIVTQSHNQMLIEMHQRTQFQYWNLRLPVMFMREQIGHSNTQHRELLEALKHGDGALAEQITHDHIGITMRIVADALEDQ